MFKVTLVKTLDITEDFIKVNQEKNCLEIYSPANSLVNPGQLLILQLPYRLEFENSVGVPYKYKNYLQGLELYFPKGGFKWSGSCEASLTFLNKTEEPIGLYKGQLLCYVSLMTVQYFNLNRRSDGSDKGLRSAIVKIEQRNESKTIHAFPQN